MAKSESALNSASKHTSQRCKTLNVGGCHGHSKHALKRLILRQQVAAAPADYARSVLDLRRSNLAQKLRIRNLMKQSGH